MKTFTFNDLQEDLRSPEERRLYARDLCMLSVTGAIASAVERAGVSRVQLAERMGRTKGFVSQVLSGSRNMTLSTMADLLWAVDLEVAGLELRPIGERRVPYEMINEWLDSEKDVVEADSVASPQESFDETLATNASLAA